MQLLLEGIQPFQQHPVIFPDRVDGLLDSSDNAVDLPGPGEDFVAGWPNKPENRKTDEFDSDRFLVHTQALALDPRCHGHKASDEDEEHNQADPLSLNCPLHVTILALKTEAHSASPRGESAIARQAVRRYSK